MNILEIFIDETVYATIIGGSIGGALSKVARKDFGLSVSVATAASQVFSLIKERVDEPFTKAYQKRSYDFSSLADKVAYVPPTLAFAGMFGYQTMVSGRSALESLLISTVTSVVTKALTDPCKNALKQITRTAMSSIYSSLEKAAPLMNLVTTYAVIQLTTDWANADVKTATLLAVGAAAITASMRYLFANAAKSPRGVTETEVLKAPAKGA